MIIGLTGSIATGKSTVSRMLHDRGFPIVDADEIAKKAVEAGSPVLQEIASVFGEEFLLPDGTMDRAKMGEHIFGNEQERQKLNAIIHPAVRTEMLRQKDDWLVKGARTVILDIPLLFESRLQHFVEKIIVVSAKPAIQKKRLMERNGFTEAEADTRISSQIAVEMKEAEADAVIDNSGTIEETERQIDRLIAEWELD